MVLAGEYSLQIAAVMQTFFSRASPRTFQKWSALSRSYLPEADVSRDEDTFGKYKKVR
jgi:hypothetical protein